MKIDVETLKALFWREINELITERLASFTPNGAAVRGPVPVTSLPAHPLVGTKHTASGLTAGQVLTASSETAFGFAALPALADHDHSGDAGDGGTFDAASLTSGAATDGHVLTADGSGGAAWEAPAGGTLALDDLSDVAAAAPTDGQVLTWDDLAGEWIADDPPAGGVVDASDVTYTPSVAADWDGGADPGNADAAFDQLAERVKDLEGASPGGGIGILEMQVFS